MNILEEIYQRYIGFPLLIFAITVGLGIIVIGYFYYKREWYLQYALLTTGWRSSWWHLVSGGSTANYFDLDYYLENPKSRRFAVNIYTKLINKAIDEIGNIDRLAFIEREVGPLGAIQLKEDLVSKTGLPAVIVRPKKRLTRASIKGSNLVLNEKILIVNDVVTTGRGILKAKNKLEQFGLKVPGAVVFLSRESKENQQTELRGIKLKYFADLSEFKTLMNEKGLIRKIFKTKTGKEIIKEKEI